MSDPATPPATPPLHVTWDSNKANSNLTKHGVSFVEASSVLLDTLAVTTFDEAHSQLEERWFTLGYSNQGRLLAVVHTYTSTGPMTARARLISAREATRQERQQYENEPH
jgi:uncharacterized protein